MDKKNVYPNRRFSSLASEKNSAEFDRKTNETKQHKITHLTSYVNVTKPTELISRKQQCSTNTLNVPVFFFLQKTHIFNT